MAAEEPEKFEYTYDIAKQQKEKPNDNFTYIGADDNKKRDPHFYWHLDEEKSAGSRLPVWIRAKSRKLSNKYKKHIEAQTAPIIEASIAQLQHLGFTTISSNVKKYNALGEPSYGYMLATGKTSANIKRENAEAKKITPEVLQQVIVQQVGQIDEETMDLLIGQLSSKLGISGGKHSTRKRSTKKRHTKKHNTRRHRKSSKKTMRRRR